MSVSSLFRLIFVVSSVVAAVAFLATITDILAPFLIGMAVAYFVDPVCDLLERLGLGRTLATLLVTLLFFLLILGFFAVVLPPLGRELAQAIRQIPELVKWLGDNVQDFQNSYLSVLSDEKQPSAGFDVGKSISDFVNQIGDMAALASTIFSSVVDGIGAAAQTLSILFITPLVSFYLLRDWDRMTGTIREWIPLRYQHTVITLTREMDEIVAGFVRGQLSVCITMAIFYSITLLIAGVKFGLLIGLVAGVLTAVPYVGPSFGFIASVSVAFWQTSDWKLPAIAVGIMLVGQVLEGNILTPVLVGGRTRLHPVWIIFALFAGGAVLGFIGLLIAIPAAAVIGVIVRFMLRNYLASSWFYEKGPRLNE